MNPDNQFPKLRWPIDIQMHQSGNEHLLVIRCPIGLIEKPLILAGGIAPILQTFEGAKSVEQIEAEFLQYGVKRDLIEELIALLDSHYFLANERFFSAQENLKLDFLKSPVRPAALAGLSYSNIPTQLASEIDNYLAVSPGKPAQRKQTGPLGVLVSPHIDYRRGGNCYGRAYQHIQGESPDVYILIGTAHQYSSLMFHLTKKDFISPLGPLPCDHFFVEKLAARYGYQRSFADELLHRREHSLELQLPFLSRIKPDCSIVPILVGSFHQMITSGTAPTETPEYDQFAAALAETIIETTRAGKNVAFIAGVDMAHVGQQFGDREKLTPQFMQQVAERDQKYLQAIISQDKNALFSHIAEDGDARKICGFPTMYTILDVSERLKWRFETTVFDYQQAVDYQTECAVTFAAVGMYHPHGQSVF